MKYTQEQVLTIIKKHGLFLSDREGGERANLSGANLRDAVGNSKEIKSLQTGIYNVNYTRSTMSIGCQQHTISEWREFSDKEILGMDGKTALKFWRGWKEVIFNIIELNKGE